MSDMSDIGWIDVAASTAQALLAYELKTDQAKWHFPINYEETHFVSQLWSSGRSGGEWGTRVCIALDVGNLQDHEAPIVPKRLLVLADDSQPWGHGNEIPVILATFDVTDSVGAAQFAQQALRCDLLEHFDQLVENEDSGKYEIQRG